MRRLLPLLLLALAAALSLLLYAIRVARRTTA